MAGGGSGGGSDDLDRYRPPGERTGERTGRTAAPQASASAGEGAGGQDPAPAAAAPRRRLRTLGLIAAALGAAAVVAVVTAVVTVALVHPQTTSNAGSGSKTGPSAVGGSSTPVPIAGPITPAEHPYDELAILRRPRLSTDVLPAGAFPDPSTGSGGASLVTGSARLLATSGKERAFLVVDSAGGVCVVQVTATGGGGATGCSSPGNAVAPGGVIGGIGAGSGLDFTIIADGTPKPGTTDGYRQIAPNVWLAKTSHAVPAPAPASSAGDPLAFPAVAPYDRFALLRRASAVTDTIPAALTSTSGTVVDSVVLSSTRLAGTYRGVTIWVGVSPSGHACLLVDSPAGDGLSSACGGATGGVGFENTGKGDVGGIRLVPDADDRAAGVGGHRLAPNVWITPPSH